MKMFFSLLFGAFISFWMFVLIAGQVIAFSVDSGRVSFTTKCRGLNGVAVKTYSSSLVCIPVSALIDVK